MSNSESPYRNSSSFCGIPLKCTCGCPVKRYTSSTSDNPGRPFYRCETMQKDHLFKWVEEAMLEELQALLGIVMAIDREVDELREVKQEVHKLREVKEEVSKLREVKDEARKLVIGFAAAVCVGVSAMVISKVW